MSHGFRGSYHNDGVIYDYSCTCSPESGGIRWQAVVLNDALGCAPSGWVRSAACDAELLSVISGSIESEIARAHAKARAA